MLVMVRGKLEDAGKRRTRAVYVLALDFEN